ncbi:MAG TPA: exonuclease domain-containing protein [Bacteroidia bacterium]|nr:exonuclease domain-containing protein [Bacteroidia bacterium]
MNYAIVDIETTGSHGSAHSITEIAIILHDGNKIIDSFQSLINPEAFINPYVSRMTGITNEMLRDAPKFHEVAKQVWNLTDDAAFIAHSVNFDYSYIRDEFKSLGADFRRKKLCTVRLSRKIFPGYPSYSLGNICAHLGIKIENRHRAMGDAAATVKLLELCMKHDKDEFINRSLKKNSKEAILPPHLPQEVFEALPEKTGVYYFHDQSGKIIYVGKAVNIKNRVYSHFTGAGSARLSFTSAIANISYTLCGTELIALLFESNEIKRLYPRYNQAQKTSRENYILSEYLDQKGIHHLMFTKNHKSLIPLTTFKSFDAGREFMYGFIEAYQLCPKYCGMQSAPGACFDYQVKKCKGICAGSEPIDQYNERVRLALENFKSSLETKMIIDEGRTWNEKSLILIEKGVYKGFGYFDATVKIDSPETAKTIITPFKHTPDVQKILNAMT